MLNRDKLQETLRNLENVDINDLARMMNMGVDDLLLGIRDEILPEYQSIYKKNAYKIPFYNREKTKAFFTSQIIDLGMLCQHVIKDIRETMKDKHNQFGHTAFHSAWLLNRGY